MKEFGKAIRLEKDYVVIKRLIAVNLVEEDSSTECVAESVGITAHRSSMNGEVL